MSSSRQQDWLQDNLSGVTTGLVALHSFFNCVPWVTHPVAVMPDVTTGLVALHSFFNCVPQVTHPAAFMPDVTLVVPAAHYRRTPVIFVCNQSSHPSLAKQTDYKI